MPTISQLMAVSSVTDTDQVPVYSTDNGDARKAALSVVKAYILTNADFTDATFTDAVLITPDIGTPSAGNLINCFGLPIVGGGTGASTADGALTNFGGTTVGKALFTASDATAGRTAISAAKSGSNSDITSITGLTTALAPTQGGTGQPTLALARGVFGSGASSRKTANYTAVAGDVLACDTIAVGAFTVTLPAAPVAGDPPIKIYDAGTTTTVNGFATNNLTIARNGNTICTLAEDVIFSTKGVSVIFEYIAGTWRMRIG